MRSKAWLAARVSLQLARLPRTASSAQHSRRLRFTRAAAPVLVAHAKVTEIIAFFRWVQNLGAPQYIVCALHLHALAPLFSRALELQTELQPCTPKVLRAHNATMIVTEIKACCSAEAADKLAYMRQTALNAAFLGASAAILVLICDDVLHFRTCDAAYIDSTSGWFANMLTKIREAFHLFLRSGQWLDTLRDDCDSDDEAVEEIALKKPTAVCALNISFAAHRSSMASRVADLNSELSGSGM